MSRLRKYPQELIERGIRLVFESGRPIAHVAADIGVPAETLRKRVRQAEIDEGRRQGLSSAEREEVKKLRKEVAKRRGKPWRTTKADPRATRARDLVERDFTACEPNRLWVGDFTYVRSWEGVSYFAFTIDVFSRKIVGWQLASHMRTTLVLDALR